MIEDERLLTPTLMLSPFSGVPVKTNLNDALVVMVMRCRTPSPLQPKISAALSTFFSSEAIPEKGRARVMEPRVLFLPT